MASRYAILPAATASNYSVTTTWSATSGGGTGASSPTSADDVYVDNLSVGGAGASLVADTASNCLSMDWTGATNTPTLEMAATLNTWGSITLITGMTHTASYFMLTLNGTGTLTLAKQFPHPISIQSGAGTVTLADTVDITTIKDFYLASGILVTGGQTISSGSCTISGASAKTLTLSSSVVNCTAWNYSGSNLTVTANTATINISGTGALAGGSADWNGASFNLNGTAHTVSGSFTCNVLTRNGTATKTDTITYTSGITITCTTCAMIGNSSTNRLLVQPSTLGTTFTITATNWTGTVNVDIMDCVATNAIDLSAITGLSGDCGGNTGITSTTAAAQTSSANGNYSGAVWGAGRVPLPQDDANISHSLTMDMLRIGKNITVTGTPTLTLSNNIELYGSVTLASGMTYTAGTNKMLLRGRGSFTIFLAAKTVYELDIYAPGGTYTFSSSEVYPSGIVLYNGTLDFNDKSMTMPLLSSSNSNTRGVLLKSGTLTLSYNGTITTNPWTFTTTTNLTFSAGTSTIICTNTSANARTFAGGSLTYNNVTIAGAGNYATTISGSNTFNIFTVDRSSAAKTITTTDGTTQTFTNVVIPVSSNTVVTLGGTGVAGWTWVSSGGFESFDYLSISYGTASPANMWYAGVNSTNGGNNTSWTFLPPPRKIGIPSVNLSMIKGRAH